MTTTFQAAQIFRREQSVPVENVGLAYAKLAAPAKTEVGGERGYAARLVRDRLATARQPSIYPAAYRRWQARTPPGMPDRLVLRFKAESPVLCGLGESTPLENGMALHHTYGTPLLPGSSLKGVTRAWMRDRYKDDAQWGPESDAIASLFGVGGDGGEAAAVDFLDAWLEPTDHPWSAEILTPHYGSYYRGDAPPDGMDGPIPVTFLGVAAATQFRVVLEGDPAWLPIAAEALRLALKEAGIGAKTRSGYGRLTELGALDDRDQEAERALAIARLPVAGPREQVGLLARERNPEEVVGHLKDWLQEKSLRDERYQHLKRDERTQLAVARWLDEAGKLEAWRKGSRAEKELRRTLLGWLSPSDEVQADVGSAAPVAAPEAPRSRFGDKALTPADVATLPSNERRRGRERAARAKRIAAGGYSEAAVAAFLEWLVENEAPRGQRNQVKRAYGLPEEA